MAEINFGAFEPLIESMGPGRRACLWVRGCPINCPSCITQEFISPHIKKPISVEEVCRKIEQSKNDNDIEGVSFSGGEPFFQAELLAEVAKFAGSQDLSVMSWSGYTLKYLRGPNAPDGSAELLKHLDVLIDGPLVAAKITNSLPLRGSTNQRLHFLTKRYSKRDFQKSKLRLELSSDSLVVSGVTDYRELDTVLGIMGVVAH